MEKQVESINIQLEENVQLYLYTIAIRAYLSIQ